MIREIQAYYPSVFFSRVRKAYPQKIVDKRYTSAINQKIAERYNSKGIKECFYSSFFDIKV